MDSETAAAPTEIELKFTIDPTDLAVFRNLAFLTDLPSKRSSLSATYFDTEDQALRRAGYALRLRRSADGTIQTLKGASEGAAGLFSRSERECAVPGDTLDDAMLAAALPVDVRAATAGRLAPLFTVDVERTEWRVAVPGAVIAVSVDQGAIQAGDHQAPISEVEFELRSGTVEAVFALAGSAVENVALHLQPLGKSERGYQLLGAYAPRPRSVASAITSPTLAAAIRPIMAELIEGIALERAAVLATGDPEAVHRLRVLLRRLRCLLEVAAETISGAKLGTSARTIRRAFRRLGTVRDLDILTAAVPQNAESADGAMSVIAADRQHAFAKVRRLLGSRGFAVAMLDLLSFSTIDRSADEPQADNEATLDEELRRVLTRRWHSVRQSRRPSKLSVRARHHLRIDVKTFRYTTDFFGELFLEAKAAKRRQRSDDAVRDLQTSLGKLNDRRNVERLARDHLGDPVTTALGLTASAPDESDLRGADKAFKRLMGGKPFWA
ncbi:CYTH and CHAD domain-containing protein [Kaistia soli]|nr:CYTH and CHAD domain-containing protein [Kaistia soli]